MQRDDDDYELTVSEAHRLALKRNMVWDLFPHGDELEEDFAKLGLSFGSEEVQELEHRDSHLRMAPCMFLSPAIEGLSEIASEILTSFMLSEHPELPEEIGEHLSGTHKAMITSSVEVIVAHLIGSGMLTLAWRE